MQMEFLIIIHIEQVQIMSASPAVVVPQGGENQLAVLSKASESCGDASLIELDKEASRLGEDISTKVRKPYTITKQRERWTDDEHQKFLEALKLYGRAWRRIEEHVGTKTAVQIRSHAQKFFSKLEREGSSGSLKAPVSEIDIPPPRPKRKPAHPYPRKGIALSSQNFSLLSQVSGTESSGCEISMLCDTAVAVMRTNKLPTSNILETTSPHPLNCSAKKASPVSFCQKPRKRGTEEVQCDAFPNEAQEMPKLSRSTCSKAELSSSPIGISALQPDTLMLHNNNMPFGVHGSKLLTTFQQMAVPYHHPMHSMAALQNVAPLLNSATTNPSQLGKLDDMPALTSLLAAHAHLSSSIMPWINHNPIALAAAAAAAATTAWPGLGLQPPPLHLPLRPPSIFSDRLNIESSSTVAAAMAAAAAASFADASAWLALHGTFAHPPNIPEGRSLYKPNPVVHSAFVEGHQQHVLTDSSEGSKNGDNGCEQTSSAEHEASTLDGMPETIAHINHPNPLAGDHSIPSSSNQQSNSQQYEKETLKTQENRGHNSSTDSSSNEKKGKRNGLNCPSGNFLLVESKNGLQDSAYLTVHGKKLGRESTEVNSSEMDLSPSMYQGSNSPTKSNISPKISKKDEEDCEYNGKINDSLDALTSSVFVTDCTLEEQSGSSVGKEDSQCITNTSQMVMKAEIHVSLQHENGSSHTSHENMPAEVSITANQRQCISSCGSTENKKTKAHDSPVISSKIKDIAMKESKPKHHTEDCGSEITPYEKAGKVLVQACLKRWQGGEIMFTHACTNSKSIVATSRGNSTCRAEAKENNSQQEEARSSLAMGLINGSKQILPLIQTQSLHESNASSSGSSKYKGHGFVPYRRS